MNEVEKMYENAGFIQKRCKDYSCPMCEQYNDCEKYPPFTAEKQIELIKLLSRVTLADYFQFFFYEIKEEWVFRLFMITEMSCELAYTYESRNKDFTEALAGLINSLWQDLTEEEKQQIKNILESKVRE